jgi:cytochrome c oxidase assembly protein subunit 15
MTLQTTPETLAPTERVRGGDVLACGFAITVGAWIVAYVSRLPMVNAPGQVTVLAMLATIFIGGIFTARHARHGIMAALLAGFVSGLLNLLLMGSIIQEIAIRNHKADLVPDIKVPASLLWVAGSILTNILFAGAGGVIGSLIKSPRRYDIRWTQVFAIVLAAATLPLITIGGLVTAFRAGLAVPDWPQSYGYNMFLFPLSQMQANHGNFYEHSHRLMGSLVGFTALALAIYATIAERRGWIKVFAWAIGFAVLIQGIIGGTRVTEKNVDLAIAHGVFAQIVFAAMVCLAAVTSRAYTSTPPESTPAASTDRAFTLALLLSLIVQLFLGALLRHKDALVMMHITMAVVVTFLALAAGIRAWGMNAHIRPIKNTGLALMALVAIQITLGILALIFRATPDTTPTNTSALITTAHQANGALLLATAATLTTWTWRLLKPSPATTPVPAV